MLIAVEDVLVAQMVAVQPFQPPLIDNGYAFWVSGVAKSCYNKVRFVLPGFPNAQPQV